MKAEKGQLLGGFAMTQIGMETLNSILPKVCKSMDMPIQIAYRMMREEDSQGVRKLLREHPELLTERGPDLLRFAAKIDQPAMVHLFIEAGVDINTGESSGTPLSVAAAKGALRTARFLLDLGADVNRRGDDSSGTPLHEAANQGQLEMVKLLLDRGADPLALFGYPRRNARALAKFWNRDEVVAYFESLKIPEIEKVDDPVDVETAAFKTVGEIGPVKFYEQKWQDVYDYGQQHGLSSMCEKNQVLFLVGYLINQLCGGGAEFLYFNPSGEYVTKMPAALDKIGAKRAADIIRQINALFPGGAPAQSMEQRGAQMGKVGDRAAPLGAELEAIFGEWVPKGERVLLVQLYDYYRAA